MAVRKRKTGYQVQWYDADGRFRKRTFRGITREEAVKRERDILAKRDRGEPLFDPRRGPTFAAFASTWIEEHRAGWRPSTQTQYADVIRCWLQPAFGALRLADVTESRVRQLVTRLEDAQLSPRRINYVVVVLRMIVRAALRRRLLGENPLVDIRPLRVPKTEVDPVNPDEVEAFLRACPAFWRPYFTVAFWTGARPSELFALKKGDVDWDSETFRIRAGRHRGVEGPPKTPGSARDVVMLPPARQALRAQLAELASRRLARGEGAPEPKQDYVFTTRAGRCLSITNLRARVWWPTLAKAGLRRRAMYQTRHTFASNALAAGESPTWVARTLGHSTPEMLFKVYARFIPNLTRRDGSALVTRMGSKEAQRTPEMLPTAPASDQEAKEIKSLDPGESRNRPSVPSAPRAAPRSTSPA